MHEYEPVARASSLKMPACSLCLRVLRGERWIDARQAIRDLRTFDLPSPVRLEPGLCDRCEGLIALRRANRLPESFRAAA